MWSAEFLAVAAAVFILAGFVKGVIGAGMPTLAIALLTATFDIKAGLVLILVPALVTNIWQSLVGGAFVLIAKRLGVFLVMASIGVWLGVGLLAKSDSLIISGLLGVMLCVYAGVSLVTPQIPPPGRHEIWLAPTIGCLSGFLAGLMGSFVVPGSLYIQALGMPRDVFVQAMGFAFTFVALALAAALLGHGLMSVELGTLSVAALVPAALGMAVGQRIRKRLSESVFRRVFFCGMLALGIYMALRAFAF